MAYGTRGPKLWRTPDEYGEFPDMTEDQLKRLRERAMNYCLWSLGESSKTTHQLVSKMRVKNCPEDIIDEVVKKLTDDYHYLDDAAYADAYMDSRKSMNWGMNKIKMYLRRNGISEEIIQSLEANVTSSDEGIEYETAKKIATRKLATTKKLERQKRVNRVVSNLVRSGFNMGVAYQVVNEVLENEEREASESEEE